MKLVCLLILFGLSTLTTNVSSMQDDPLSQFHWENRVVITTINSEQTLKGLEKQLKQIWPEFEERKLVVFAIYNAQAFQLNPQASPSQQNVQEASRRLNNRHTLLIGLDGGSKAVYDSFDSQQIFADIDAMPMRRARLDD